MRQYSTWNNICFVLFWIFAVFTAFLFYGASQGYEGLLTPGISWSFTTAIALFNSGRLI